MNSPTTSGLLSSKCCRTQATRYPPTVNGTIPRRIGLKNELEHGQFTEWVVRELQFGTRKAGSREADLRKADMLMFLARNEIISKSCHDTTFRALASNHHCGFCCLSMVRSSTKRMAIGRPATAPAMPPLKCRGVQRFNAASMASR
jgi:hypothetical protein